MYRTYIRNQTAPATDKRYIHQALREAAARNPAVPRPVFAFLRQILLPGASSPRRGKQGGKHESARREFVCRWQQLTGPAMAKGFEDTALYVYNRLISLNDVGGEPQAGGITSGTFLSRLKTRQKLWPHTLNTTSTHDTKRSEDVRAGINVLSELAPEWAKHLPRWARWNKSSKPTVNGRPVPDPNEEILLYQTLLGSWPRTRPLEDAGLADSNFNYPERIRSFMVKAAREAKIHSNWLEPNTEYETALCVFVERLLKPSSENRFLNNFLVFQKKIARFGAWNSLSQTLLKLTLPGVPDLYQGNELWDLSLVDPDNRRPVGFERRARYLEELKKKESENRTALIAGLLRHWEDGRLKLYLTWKALRFRRTHHELFREGEILAVGTAGACKDHLCAFARRGAGKAGRSEWAIVAVPRLMAGRAGRSAFPTGRKVWGNTALLLPKAAPTVWKNVLTGERLDCRRQRRGRERGRKKVLLLGEVFRSFPAALLAPGEEGNG